MGSPNVMASTQREIVLHYATSDIVPQQSKAEIKLAYDVLRERAPCNFLVFGLGLDSQMWHAFNPGGKTLFLEEDPKWWEKVLQEAPFLNGKYIEYRTQLKEADQLFNSYKFEPDCDPAKGIPLKENEKCKLALNMLPDEVYDTEWDLIMIDAPKGYFPEAPGRMAAIYSAAVMARNRKGQGGTHVYLHDVDRKTEKTYAEEFLCKKNLVKGEGRLWHFFIPPVVNSAAAKSYAFC
ncbi:hypothetical protein AgCh_018190 [Apium graveolens]